MQKLRKILNLSLSVYLLLLMMVPCSHHKHEQAYSNTQHTLIQAQGQSAHEDIDLCTPFCICGNCMAAIVLQPVLDIKTLQPQQPATTVNSFYKQQESAFYGAIWQPPKLV
ncbi:DUF6660 family protein [Flavobacterium rhizosphaerae]|uniref:DUF6660 family protein n=1 Tax=Flavobacterium rhizosphaerae TaxID=3163298 RepID=A0ABW8YUK1_9FLAO